MKDSSSTRIPIYLILSALVLIIIFISCAIWSYYKQIEINSLRASVEALKIDKTTLESRLNSGGQKDSLPNNEMKTLTIAELGIKIQLPKGIEDITYEMSNGETDDKKPIIIANFSTESISKLDSACGAGGGASPLGALSRVNGPYPNNPTATNSGGMLTKQFTSFYIARRLPQAQCSENLAIEQEATTARELFTEALQSIRE